LAIFFDFQKFVNIWIRDEKFSVVEVNSIIDMYKTFNEVLWIIDFSFLEAKSDEISQIILDKLSSRNQAKLEKDFVLADNLRQEIEDLWYKIVDSKTWTRLEKI
jgi:cysteinyl-tRNA synthetase